MILRGMLDLCWVIFKTFVDLFRPRAALGAEMLVLRQQIVVLRRGKAGPVMGRPAHPRRAAHAWLRGRGVDRLQVHGQTPRTAIADVADIPAQPCEYNCGGRPLCGSDPDV